MSFSAENCTTIIEKLLGSKEFSVDSFELLPFRNPLQGLVGEHFTLKITYVSSTKKKTQEFFVKTLNSNPVLLDLSKTIMVFEKEKFFYNLLEEYNKYKIDTSFAPKGYLFENFTTVLEDVSLTGYQGTPKLQLLDSDHCKTALEALAKFHGASIIYERKKSEETGKKFCFPEEYPAELEDKFASGKESIATRWLQSAICGVLSLIDLIPENRVSNELLKEKLTEILVEDEGGEPEGLINAILHNDLWTSNFLYTYNARNIPTHGKLLDFQTLIYGPVELDLMKFFMTNTTRQFRQENMINLIEYYYKKLTELLIRNGVNSNEEISLPSTSLEFIESCRNFALPGKVHAIVDHSYTFMSDEIYGDVMRTGETFRNFLFEGRSKFIIDSFHKNEVFRRVLSEDVADLRHLFFPDDN